MAISPGAISPGAKYWQFHLVQSNDKWQNQKSGRLCLAPRKVTRKLSLSILVPTPRTYTHTLTHTYTLISLSLSLSLSHTHIHTHTFGTSLSPHEEFLIKYSSLQSFCLPTSAKGLQPLVPELDRE